MTTIRSRIPVLLFMLIDRGAEIKFDNHMGGAVISWSLPGGSSGHYHLDNHTQEEYGARSIELENALASILSDYSEDL